LPVRSPPRPRPLGCVCFGGRDGVIPLGPVFV
ncbi:hypothetical protein BAE44_0016816, partial [Dichanthelium oligosanthes]